MVNHVFEKSKLSSRHVTERTSRTLLRSYFRAMRLRGEYNLPMRQAQAFKRGAAAGVTVTGRTVNENLSKVVSNGDQALQIGDAESAKRKKDWKLRKTNLGSGALWKCDQVNGAAVARSIHPGASNETKVHAYV
ncbi:MAG TPA: hypothetical protein VIE66_07490 [Methylocella sp.]